MNRIKVLPEILANKIAAGEIVERPASVVKELVENSLDAKSQSIFVSVQTGGKRFIQIRDDGIGMTQDDAILAFEHHATSKIQTIEDLGSVATLGFRGEALPSIASVARLNLKTCTGDLQESSGTELEINGGVLRSVKPVSWDKGTEITVRDLFFNMPARRKFLKTNETENGHIARTVMHYALANPEIRFRLQSGERVLLDAAPAKDFKERIYQTFGEKYLDNLVEFSGSDKDIRLFGFCSQPHERRTNTFSQYFYVNKRMVRDRVISGAVRQAYQRCMPASAHPVVILFLELPYDQVDVNAHPAKTEIRFHRQKAIFNLVKETLERSLSYHTDIPDFETSQRSSSASFVADSREWNGKNFTTRTSRADVYTKKPAYDSVYVQNRSPYRDESRENSLERGDAFQETVANLPSSLLNEESKVGGLFHDDSIRILGQFHNSYIIASDSRGLLIIDQHVAHERILYEKLKTSIESHSIQTQGLLTPISMDLAPHQIALIDKVLPELNRSGFDVEHFGSASVLIRSVPAIAGESDCRELLKEILENLEKEERGLDIERIRDRIAVKTACQAAVKVNMPLSIEKMRWLVEKLAHTNIPTSCPHGRPVILRFSNYEIEKKFGRA